MGLTLFTRSFRRVHDPARVHPGAAYAGKPARNAFAIAAGVGPVFRRSRLLSAGASEQLSGELQPRVQADVRIWL